MKVQILTRQSDGGARRATGLKILELPRHGKHNFRKDWLQRVKKFATVTDDKIILHTVDGDVIFKVNYVPGRYCLTCDEKLPDVGADPFAEKCRAHVLTHDEPVVTERWPDGYIATKSHITTLEKN